MIIKIYYLSEIRRLRNIDISNFQNLLDIIKSVYHLDSDENVVLKYKDDENDLCTISDDASLDDAISLVEGQILRIWMTKDSSEKNENMSSEHVPNSSREDRIVESRKGFVPNNNSTFSIANVLDGVKAFFRKAWNFIVDSAVKNLKCIQRAARYIYIYTFIIYITYI
eukprot:GHVL01011678.1.p1 GENE.GHVL01011678.1~~GHVL01011678.1.p1  ORF type:complete len:168 (+),score=31.99 GHVL01011678.1:28-531(+)